MERHIELRLQRLRRNSTFVNVITAGDSGGFGGQLQYYSGHGQLSVASSRNAAGRHARHMLLQQYTVCIHCCLR